MGPKRSAKAAAAPAQSAEEDLAQMAMQLLTLARDNKHAQLKQVAQLGVPVNMGNAMGQTALHIAALWGNVETINALLEVGAKVNIKNIRGITPLHFAAAAKKNAKAACEALLKGGADAEVADMSGRVPFENAIADDVRAMLGGPDPRIFELAEAGKGAELRKLLAEEASVRVQDSGGRTPLNLAILSNDLDTVKAILEFDPKCIDVPDAAGDTAMHTVVEEGNEGRKPAILAHLLSLKPACLNAQNLSRSEYAAGNWLLKGEVVEPLDKTPLHMSVEEGDVETAQALIEGGADTNIPDFDRRTVLHMAQEDGNVDMVQMLLSKGADPNAPSNDFVSCVHYSATKGPVKMLELLLDKGGDARAAGEGGWTPLHLACRVGKEDRAGLLIQAGADLNAANDQGSTPLHLAAVNGHVGAVRLLVAKGADTSVKNKQEQTAASMAKTPEVAAAIEGKS